MEEMSNMVDEFDDEFNEAQVVLLDEANKVVET
jgi:hypothetical protein